MPVTFTIDPKLPKDVGLVTLAYTFFDVTKMFDADQTAKIFRGEQGASRVTDTKYDKHLPLKEKSTNGG